MDNQQKKVLVTGGTGFIGSHTVVELLHQGYNCVIADNLCNSKLSVLQRIEKICGKKPAFYQADMLNKQAIDEIFEKENIYSVMHFAGLKAVGESVKLPLMYYQNNITGTLNLLETCIKHNVKQFVFSSSATVYGAPASVPVTEDFPTSATNPYGQTKLFVEQILRDTFRSDKTFNIAVLRYFNPIGAHPSGLLGEDPNGIPNNLAPYILQVAAGKLEKISVFGNDYNTKDGTGIRDYIHVVDLAKGHINALKKLDENCGLLTVNLGTGKGVSVMEMISAFSEACGRALPFTFAPRREGDVAMCYADPTLARKALNWKATLTLADMAKDGWNFQQMQMKEGE